MVSKKVTVINEQGVHMRPAGEIVKTAKGFQGCEVLLNANGKSVKAASPMQIMAACIKKGNEVEIVCNGENESDALNAIADLFSNGFGE